MYRLRVKKHLILFRSNYRLICCGQNIIFALLIGFLPWIRLPRKRNDALKGDFFCFPSAFEESSRQPMYRNRRQHQKCNASTPTKPILHEKCNYHGKDEYSHVLFYGALIFPIAILSIIWYNISVKLVAKTDNNPQTMCKTVIVAELFSLGCEEPVWDYQAYAWRT